MKPVTLLTILSLMLSIPAVSADENIETEKETIAFCEEQSRLAGIDDAQEKNEYIQICAENYGVTVGEAAPSN